VFAARAQAEAAAAMARPLLLQVQAEAGRTTTSSHAAGAAPLLLVLFAAAAVVVSLCTSSKNASKPWKQGRVRGGSAPELEEKAGGGSFVVKKQLLASLSGIGGKKQLLASLSGKAAAVARMVSWNKRSPPPEAEWSSDDGAEDEEALWKKAIIMGDKCRLLEFSGQIAYDSDGNRLPPPPPPAESIEKSAATGADNE
jgi:hypothetical protein